MIFFISAENCKALDIARVIAWVLSDLYQDYYKTQKINSDAIDKIYVVDADKATMTPLVQELIDACEDTLTDEEEINHLDFKSKINDVKEHIVKSAVYTHCGEDKWAKVKFIEDQNLLESYQVQEINIAEEVIGMEQSKTHIEKYEEQVDELNRKIREELGRSMLPEFNRLDIRMIVNQKELIAGNEALLKELKAGNKATYDSLKKLIQQQG